MRETIISSHGLLAALKEKVTASNQKFAMRRCTGAYYSFPNLQNHKMKG